MELDSIEESTKGRMLLIMAITDCLRLQGYAVLTGVALKKYNIELGNVSDKNLVFEGMPDRDVILIYRKVD